MTIENIADQRFARNESIVQVMADFGLIERLGYGINRMFIQDGSCWACHRLHLPKPTGASRRRSTTTLNQTNPPATTTINGGAWGSTTAKSVPSVSSTNATALPMAMQQMHALGINRNPAP
jgi:hypothetical protein